MHREPTMKCGGIIKGEAPPSRGGVRELSQNTFKQITTPQNMQMLQNHAGAQKSRGDLWGCVHPQGAYECMGHMNVWGAYEHGGVQTPPQV